MPYIAEKYDLEFEEMREIHEKYFKDIFKYCTESDGIEYIIIDVSEQKIQKIIKETSSSS